MSKILKKLNKITGNEFAFVASSENNPYKVKEYVDTGVYALNAILSDGDIFKGLPKGKRVSFYGAQSTAKSYLTLYTAKAFLDANPNNILLVFETEGATVLDMAESIGLDKERIGIIPVHTVEDLKFELVKLIDEIKKERESGETTDYCFLLDSLGMLSSKKELEDALKASDKRDMTRAQMVRSLFRTISLDLTMLGIPFLIVSHSYNTMEMYSVDEISGGGGVKFASDIIIHLTKSKEKEGTKRVGSIITLKVIKSRFVQEEKKIKLALFYGKGLYKYSYLLEYGLELGVIKKEGISYVLNGVKMKKKAIAKEPEKFFTPEALEILRDAIRNDMALTGVEINEDEMEEMIEQEIPEEIDEI